MGLISKVQPPLSKGEMILALKTAEKIVLI